MERPFSTLRWRQTRAAFAVAFGVCSVAANARAEEPTPPLAEGAAQPKASAADGKEDARQEAARRFEHAIKLYEEGDYALALAEFERVHELVPDYRVLYNIGQVSIQLGRYARAMRTLREYLKQGGAELAADRVAQVQADLNLLAERTAQLVVRVDRPGAEISIDGAAVGTSPLSDPVIVDVGQRRISVRLDGYRPQSKAFALAGGDRRESDFVLELDQPSEVPAPPRSVAVPPPPKDQVPPGEPPSRPWLWVGWASASTLAAGALVTGALGVSAANELAELGDTPGADRSDLDDAQSRAEGLFLAADLLGAAALVTGGITLYFQLSSPPSRRSAAAASVALTTTANRLTLTLRY